MRRSRLRAEWSIPVGAIVLGMIGGIKPQKAYPQAVRVLREVRRTADAYLVIVGGPIGRHGTAALAAVRAQIGRLDLEPYVRLLGFVPEAAALACAFDVYLNTSLYEGSSIATLEALAQGLPTVVSAVGGQVEIEAPGLTLMPGDSPPERWADGVLAALAPAPPAWNGFPSHRMWSLATLAARPRSGRRTQFVTANLNLGGAQRSLVNLIGALGRDCELEVVVTTRSTWHAFEAQLAAAGATWVPAGDSRDVFDQADAIVERWADASVGTVVFWNVDAKLKLVLAQAARIARLPVHDVSPGGYAREEMRAVSDFAGRIGSSPVRYYASLTSLVHKYRTVWPEAATRQYVVPNGVHRPGRVKTDYRVVGTPRVVVAGRIAPSKFLAEIVAAISRVRSRRTEVELHVFGAAEPRHVDYERAVFEAPGHGWIVRHAACVDVAERLADFDVFVVLGEEQGSPNALLEALAAGLPAIANDSGGTGEQVIHRRTGWLLANCAPEPLAAAVEILLSDRALAARLGTAGRRHVERSFSIAAMRAAYRGILAWAHR